MDKFFAAMYEWFGLLPLYSKDMGEFLKGLDISCVGYFALPWYFYTGLMLLITTTILFGLQYDIISGRRFKARVHWSLAGLMIFIVNYFIAFTIPATALLMHRYCPALNIGWVDAMGFGISNALWGLMLFSLLGLIKRLVSTVRAQER